MGNLSYPYLDRSRQYLVDLVLHLLEHSDSVVFIEGPAGSGRTTLLQYIEQQFIELTADQPDLIAACVDDADLLPESELARLLPSSGAKRLILTGLPGTFETIKQSGYFSQQPIERLTIAPFTRSDAEQFINAYCAPVSEQVRQRLIDHCRLYPGELQQASYDNELSPSHPVNGKVVKKAALLPVALLGLLALIWIGNQPAPNAKRVPVPTEQTTISKKTAGPIIRANSINPPKAALGQPIAASQPESIPPQPAPETPDIVAPASSKPAPVIIPNSVGITKTQADPLLPALDRDELSQLNPQHFTLQIMLATELENIDRLVARFKLISQSYRYAKIVEQKLLYCLLLGDFDSYEAAGAAINGLPEELRQLGPWRRRFQAIQIELPGTEKK